jgi:hypothetical protein
MTSARQCLRLSTAATVVVVLLLDNSVRAGAEFAQFPQFPFSSQRLYLCSFGGNLRGPGLSLAGGRIPIAVAGEVEGAQQ